MTSALPNVLKQPARWPWIGGAVALLLGVLDAASMQGLGVEITVGEQSQFTPIMLYFSVSFGAFGWAIGKLLQLRHRAKRDAVTIAAQLEALERSRRALVEAEKLASLGAMAAGVAHEVRNPLGVIRSSASLLEEGLPAGDSQDRKVCGFIREEVDRLDGFVGAILDYARPVTVKWRQVDLRDVAQRAVVLAGAHLGERQVRIEGTATVAGDEDLLVQVILGLVVNAAEATLGDGNIVIVLSPGEPEPTASGFAAIDVCDDGDGVAKVDQTKLMEPFFTTKARGTGLGLAMASRVSEAHGGRLEHVGMGLSERGATFRMTLPIETPQTSQTPQT
ncbi:MAG: hypothetical protein KC502_19035 [Myxococcales bacterium]|nr:hypothetical protein [Myxococcales bacterium]